MNSSINIIMIILLIPYINLDTEKYYIIKDKKINRFLIDTQIKNNNPIFFYDISKIKNTFLYFSIRCEGFSMNNKLQICYGDLISNKCGTKIYIQNEFSIKTFDKGLIVIYYYKIENIKILYG